MRKGLTVPHMRPRLSTLALSIATAATTIAAAYWRDKSTWHSQDEIDAWNTRARIALADMDEEASPNGEAKMLVVRHDDPIDPREPFYWHSCVAGPSPAGTFRPILERSGWAPTRRAGFEIVDLATDDLLIDLLIEKYDAFDGMDLDDIEFEDFDDDSDGVPSA